jgi:glycosyltransferase involved in cell wall biosynthesis
MSINAFFSVVIPTLNEEDYLPKILSDFAKQKEKKFEVIIIDAASKDKTKERALKFSKFFPLQFCTVEKKNVAYQRNFGAKNAKGEYLIFLDADARVDSNFTKNIYADIVQKKQKEGLLFLPVLTTDTLLGRNKVLFKLINSVIELSQSLNRPLAPGGSIFISKGLFFDLNGFNENLYVSEDHDLVQRAKDFGVKAKILKNVKVVFNLRRVKKEGQAVVLYKYFLALVYMLVNEKVTSKTFMYEMGGDKYKDLKLEDKRGVLKGETARLQKLFKKTSAFLAESLS